MHMAAIDTDQSLMRKALDESGRWTAVHLGSYENFVRDQFCFLLGALIVLLMLAGLVVVLVYPFKKSGPRNERATEIDGVTGPGSQPLTRVAPRYREVFVQTMAEDLAVLQLALTEGRARAVLSMLHRMHGALAAVGMDEFAGRCEVLGRDGRQHGLDDETAAEIATLVRDLQRMLRWQ